MGEKEGAKRYGEKKPGAAAALVHRVAYAMKFVSGFKANVNIDSAGIGLKVKHWERREYRTYKRVELLEKDGGAARDRKREEEKKKAAEGKKPIKDKSGDGRRDRKAKDAAAAKKKGVGAGKAKTHEHAGRNHGFKLQPRAA